MNPTTKSSQTFSSYRYSGATANLLWSLGWAATAALAIKHGCLTGKGADFINASVAFVVAAFGSFMTVRLLRREKPSAPDKEYPKEPLIRRISGWIGVAAWGAVGILWNLASWSILLHAANDGNSPLILIMIPFSLIGWFLLLMVCVFVTMTFDSIVKKMTSISKRSQLPPGIDGKSTPQP